MSYSSVLNDNILIRRLHSAIERIHPDMESQCVLTEAASGPFVSTSLLAALAGASKVIAIARNSKWGTAESIKTETLRLAERLGIRNIIHVEEAPPEQYAKDVDIVTNLGFVRPITRELISKLPSHAAIALMWEPWEFRESDIDRSACMEYDIPIVATNEHHPNVATFRFIGLLALKLLMDVGFEIYGLKFLVIGSNPFGQECVAALQANGAHAEQIDPTVMWPLESEIIYGKVEAIVVVEHRLNQCLLDSHCCPLLIKLIEERTPIIHICGCVDTGFLIKKKCFIYPEKVAPFGFMSVTTAHLGYKPVVDLHCAGLHASSIVARAKSNGFDTKKALQAAEDSGYGLCL